MKVALAAAGLIALQHHKKAKAKKATAAKTPLAEKRAPMVNLGTIYRPWYGQPWVARPPASEHQARSAPSDDAQQ